MSVCFVTERILIYAPLDRCFALSTRIELVQKTLGMKPVEGVTSGHVQAGSRVTWRGWKFGWPTKHRTLITGFRPPHDVEPGVREAWFQDSQERGRFTQFRHDHFFREMPDRNGVATVLRDEVRFALPWGSLGRALARHVMAPYIERLIRRRFRLIKQLAEGDGWRQWLDAAPGPGI